MKKNKIVILVISLIFTAAIFTKGFGIFSDSTTNPSNVSGFISISVSEITNRAKWYEYENGKEKIIFFAIKADDGTIRTAFDACDVCYTEKKGYRQEENYMVCNNCGNRYPISGLGTENKTSGGCWPGHLPSTVEGDKVIIKKADLENS